MLLLTLQYFVAEALINVLCRRYGKTQLHIMPCQLQRAPRTTQRPRVLFLSARLTY